jgi:hypothetical protein
MSREYTASCAVCGGPGEPECPCEGQRLQQCIDQAEKTWIESWVGKTRYEHIIPFYFILFFGFELFTCAVHTNLSPVNGL